MITAPEYTEAEREERDRVLKDLNDAVSQRKTPYMEFDDMTYDEWYLWNRQAASGYIKPRKNRQDVSVVTGTTREKVNTIVTALLRYNFDYSIEPYDTKNLPDRDVGTGMEGLVKKSRELECPNYESKRPDIYNEFVAQGNVFVLETWTEENVIRKTINAGSLSVDDISKIKWTEKLKDVKKYCNTVVIPGINVYLGNVREKSMEKQPFYGLRRELTYAQAKAEYGNWERFKNVPRKKVYVLNDKGPVDTHWWTMTDTSQDMVEEVRYYNHFLNCYQVLLNGVMMLPIGFPVEYLLGINAPALLKGDGESMGPNFAYCRGISAKNKFNQAVVDEFFKIMVLKFRKSTFPPLANNTGKLLNDSINWPGTIHKNIDPEKLVAIGQNNSVTEAEFRVFELVKNTINEASVSPVFEGNAVRGEQTAKEISELKSQSLMKLGMIIVGIILLEQKMVWTRIYNIMRHWTEEVDKNLNGLRGELVYRRETIDSQLEDGSAGKRIIEMLKGKVPEPTQIKAEEDVLSEQYGVPVRKTYLNVDDLLAIKWRFMVNITPSERDTSELRNILEEEGIAKVSQLLQPGVLPQDINREFVKERAANRYKLDPRKLFVQNAPVPQMIPEMEGLSGQGQVTQGGGGAMGAQMFPQGQKKPSLTKLLGK